MHEGIIPPLSPQALSAGLRACALGGGTVHPPVHACLAAPLLPGPGEGWVPAPRGGMLSSLPVQMHSLSVLLEGLTDGGSGQRDFWGGNVGR